MKSRKIIDFLLFKVLLRPRTKPREYEELAKAFTSFRDESYKALKIPQIVEWLDSKLRKKDKPTAQIGKLNPPR